MLLLALCFWSCVSFEVSCWNVISCFPGCGEICFSLLMSELRVAFADIVHLLHAQRVIERRLVFRRVLLSRCWLILLCVPPHLRLMRRVLARCDQMVGVAGRPRRIRRVLRMLSFCLLLGSSMR